MYFRYFGGLPLVSQAGSLKNVLPFIPAVLDKMKPLDLLFLSDIVIWLCLLLISKKKIISKKNDPLSLSAMRQQKIFVAALLVVSLVFLSTIFWQMRSGINTALS